jgi:serine/threonine protein kinase
VWEASREDGTKAALKFLDCRSRPSLIASEVRVLRGLAGLKHPHIIDLQTVHACGRYMILVMELADGNLADLQAAYLKHAGTDVPADHALELLEQAAAALDFLATAQVPGVASTRGLQHCDIKPSNLLLVGNKLKVADFGLCAGTGWQTHKGGWKGTLPYAAPELYKGSATVGTDQYALAVTYCELVMNDRPFWKLDRATPASGMNLTLPIDLTKLREKEAQVIARALHPYPSSRWPTCHAFIQALRKVVELPRGGPSVRIFPRGPHGSLRSSGRIRNLRSAAWL